MRFPRPHRKDENDVVWALETARVQWDRGARADAVVWIRRASEAALQIGAQERAGELKASAEALIEFLWSEAPPLEDEFSAAEDVEVSVEATRGPGGDVVEDEPTRPLHQSADEDPTDEQPASGPSEFLDSEAPEELEELDASVLRTLPPEDPDRAVLLPSELLESEQPPPQVSSENGLHVTSEPQELGLKDLFARGVPPDPGRLRAQVLDVGLDEVPGLQDLPSEVQLLLARIARLSDHVVGEEVIVPGAALVITGQLQVMAAESEMVAAVIGPGELAYTRGSLLKISYVRLVAGAPTRLANWSRDDLERQMRDYPWVADELRRIGDRYQALSGVVRGPLGAKLDDSLRALVTDRLQAVALKPGELIVAAGQRIPGLHLLGAGAIEILGNDGESVESELQVGEFLFAAEEMSASPAPRTARAGTQGAVILFGERQVAHELLTSVPPLIELLTS